MKTNIKIILIFAAAVLCLAACSKPQSSGIALSSVMDEITAAVDMGESQREDLTSQASAAKFGLSAENISEGVVVYSTEENRPDKIILLRVKGDEVLQDVEYAVQTHLTETINAWENDEAQKPKLDRALLKTSDDCIILAIVNNADEIEEIFDRSLGNER